MTISVKIKENLLKKIYKLSKTTNKNASYYVNKALEDYIDEQEDIKIALKRLNDNRDLLLSPRQMRKSLGI